MASVLFFFTGIIIYGIILNTREVSLQECMDEKSISTLANVRVVIDKNKYRLHLYSDTLIVKSYKAVFGRINSSSDYNYGEMITPSGKFKICKKIEKYKYHKMMLLNYPNENIAADALRRRKITTEQYNQISLSQKSDKCPPSFTPLGSDIGIHGIGEYNFIFKNLPFVFNWTNGSVAVSNEDIDELFGVLPINTEVIIKQ
ncbi:MAG: L,D-transpeptidase [Melioribacteraceae bacterium]|nr:L,D-transpeptidase [Melioribacteraceae bacterium]